MNPADYKDPATAFPIIPGNARWTWEACYTDGTSSYKCTACRKEVRALTPEQAEYKHKCIAGENDRRP